MLLNIANWKFLSESEVENYNGSDIEVYDGHYDRVCQMEAVVVEVNGNAYLCAIDTYRTGIYPVVEKNGRLEIMNTFTIGKIDGREKFILENMIPSGNEVKLIA